MSAEDSIETPISRRLSSVRNVIIVLSGKGVSVETHPRRSGG